MHTGYDASYMDPLGHMMLGSEDYRYFMQVMQVIQGLKLQGLAFRFWVSPAVFSVLYVLVCSCCVLLG